MSGQLRVQIGLCGMVATTAATLMARFTNGWAHMLVLTGFLVVGAFAVTVIVRGLRQAFGSDVWKRGS